MRQFTRIIEWFGCAVLLLALPLAAQNTHPDREKHGLQADFDMTSARPRADAPQLVVWRISWARDRLLEGFFHIELYKDGRLYADVKSSDLVVTTGESSYRMMLPADSGGPFYQHSMNVEFVGRDRSYDLGEYELIDRYDRHECNVCVVSGRFGQQTPFENEFERGLHIDYGFRRPSDGRGVGLPVTMTTQWEPRDMPMTPLQLTAFDLVFLNADALPQLAASQVEALRAWVRAGGRLALLLGEPLRATHVTWVRSMLEQIQPGLGATIDDEGLPRGDLQPDGIWMGEDELGRFVIVPQADPDSSPLDGMAATANRFIWHRDRTASTMLRQPTGTYNGAYGALDEQPDEVESRLRDNRYATHTEGMFTTLMPSAIKAIPSSYIAGMLALFVILVGPVDYVVLRTLRLQRFTWITFPLLSIVSAWGCVTLANVYLGSQDKTLSLVIRDVDGEGRLLLENRFVLLFEATPRLVDDHVGHALYTPMRSKSRSSRDTAPPPRFYEGSVPADYRVQRQVFQWGPQLERTLTFGTEEHELPVAHQQLLAELISQVARTDPDKPAELPASSRSRLMAVLGDNSQATVVVGAAEIDNMRFAAGFRAHASNVFGGMTEEANDPLITMSRASIESPQLLLARTLNFVHGMSCFIPTDHTESNPHMEDYFVRCDLPLAPVGGATYQDLAVMNLADPRQGLLIVVQLSDNQIIAYRHRFKRGPT